MRRQDTLEQLLPYAKDELEEIAIREMLESLGNDFSAGELTQAAINSGLLKIEGKVVVKTTPRHPQ